VSHAPKSLRGVEENAHKETTGSDARGRPWRAGKIDRGIERRTYQY